MDKARYDWFPALVLATGLVGFALGPVLAFHLDSAWWFLLCAPIVILIL